MSPATGLKAGRSTRLIRDEIRAGLSQRLDTAEGEALAVVLRHLGLTRMLAGHDRNRLQARRGWRAGTSGRRWRAQAKQIEQARRSAHCRGARNLARVRDAGELTVLIDQVENATDCFDEAAFFISLRPEDKARNARARPLRSRRSRESRATAPPGSCARWRPRDIPEGDRGDADFALECSTPSRRRARRRRGRTGRHWRDHAFVRAARREFRWQAATRASWCSGLEIARTLEEATDCIAHAAMVVAQPHSRRTVRMSAELFQPVLIGPGGARPAPSRGAYRIEGGGTGAADRARPAGRRPLSSCRPLFAPRSSQATSGAQSAAREASIAGVGGSRRRPAEALGDARAPLFVSVRSGAEKSMPGMLETILDVGMNGRTVHGLIRIDRQSAHRLRQLSALRPVVRRSGRRRADRSRFDSALARMIEDGGRRPRGASSIPRRWSGWSQNSSISPRGLAARRRTIRSTSSPKPRGRSTFVGKPARARLSSAQRAEH